MKCDKKDLLLYAVTDRSWLNGETLYSQVEKALEGGATFVQLREKHLDHDAFLQEAKEIKELCAKYQVPFVLDDDVELALEVGADGVHVGQSVWKQEMSGQSLVKIRLLEFRHRQWSRHF